MTKLSLLIVFFPLISYAQEVFSFELYFEDISGNKDTLLLGYDPLSTDSIDISFGEVNIANQIWDSIFEVRTFENFFVPDTAMLKKDIRPIESYIGILVKYQGNELTISWDSTLFNNLNIQGSSIDSDLITMHFLKNKSSAVIPKQYLTTTIIEEDTLSRIFLNFSDVFASIAKNEESDILVYPNPTQGKVQIKPITKNTIIEIFDLNGKSIFKTNTTGADLYFDFSNYDSGTYIVNLIDNGIVVKSKKVIVNK